MEPHIPDLEIFAAFKWIALLMLASGLMTLAGLIVKKWWYGAEKHNRREDTDDSRGVIEILMDLVKLNTEAMSALKQQLHDNGAAIRELASSLTCGYEESQKSTHSRIRGG